MTASMDDNPSPTRSPSNRRLSTWDLQQATDRGERWAMLTSYDALTAKVFEDAGVAGLLVGDTAASVVFGKDTTLPVTIDEMIPLVRAVAAATHRPLIMADLPFGTYEASDAVAVRSAGRFVKEAGAQAVKLEGGGSVLSQVRAIVRAGIPVCGHLGLYPQHVHVQGGYRVQGRSDGGETLLRDAVGLQDAGVFAVVLEAVPRELGERISEELRVPVIGIGAGSGCDAQILVWQDMAGLTSEPVPRFVKRYADLRSLLATAVTAYVNDVTSGTFPAAEHEYGSHPSTS